MPTTKSHQCQGKTLMGCRCRRQEIFGTGYCSIHLPKSTVATDEGIPLFDGISMPLYVINKAIWHDDLEDDFSSCCSPNSNAMVPVMLSPKRSDLPTYTLESRIGSGTYGNVYLAKIAGNDKREVAIKILKDPLYKHLSMDNFATEFRMHEAIRRRINDPYTLKHVLLGNDYFLLFKDRKLYGAMTMDIMDGNAYEAIKNSLPVETQLLEAQKISIILCRTLLALHNQHIYHLDVKAGNILYSRKNGAKNDYRLCDFGLSGYYNGKCPVKVYCTGTYIPPEWRKSLSDKHVPRDECVEDENETKKAELYSVCTTILKLFNEASGHEELQKQNENFHNFLENCSSKYPSYRTGVSIVDIIQRLEGLQGITYTNPSSSP